MIQLKTSLQTLPEIKELLSEVGSTLFSRIALELPDLAEVAITIDRAIKDDPPYLTNGGSLIKDGYDAQLDELKASIKDAVDYIG